MSFQEGFVFAAEIVTLMVFLLIGNVFLDDWHLGNTDRENSISILPFKILTRRFFVDPGGTLSFDLAHDLGGTM